MSAIAVVAQHWKLLSIFRVFDQLKRFPEKN